MAQTSNEYTGTWIPAVIMENENLNPTEKVLYAEIASFIICYRSNEVLAQRLGVSVRTVQSGIQKLLKLGVIVVEGDNNSRTLSSVQNLRGGMQNLHKGTQNLHTKNTHKENKDKTHTSAAQTDSASLPATSSEGDGNKLVMDSAARAAHLKKVFDTLVSILQPGQKILYTEARKSKLRKRLETFKPSQLVNAARNLMQDPWNTGQNPNNKKYADFDFLMRNDEKVEKWLNEKPVSKPKSVF